jgi:hypothetical protein
MLDERYLENKGGLIVPNNWRTVPRVKYQARATIQSNRGQRVCKRAKDLSTNVL